MAIEEISSRQGAVDRLRSFCERGIRYLIELQEIHLTIEDLKNTAKNSGSESTLRLRKALFHIQAITSWIVTTDVIHVVAPEIRAARDQIEHIILGDFYHDCDDVQKSERQRATREYERTLAPFSHPTPMILIHTQHVGGFGETDAIACYVQLHVLLMGLACDYATGLGVVASVVDRSKVRDVTGVINRITKEVDSLSSDPFLRFAGAQESKPG